MERLNIQIFFCTPGHSNTDGKIERVHSTIKEISRCIKEEFYLINEVEAKWRAVQQYNKRIHSVTNLKPIDVLYNNVKHDEIAN